MNRMLLALFVSFVTGCTAPGGGDDSERAAEGAACSAPAYKAGTHYDAGARVTAGGKTYECKPWPYSGWCSVGGGAYEPGTGYAWRDAWTEAGSCGGSTPPPSSPSSPPPSSGTCGSSWTAGKSYKTGDVVSYGGKYYVATHDNPGYDPTISTWFWSPTTCGSTPPKADPPPPASGGSGLSVHLSSTVFEKMFPARNGFYTYEGLVEATKKYPQFGTTGSTDDQKREIAAFLANVAHETGYLVYVEEIAKADYTDYGIGCTPAPGKRYYGRGPIQISWNYNYCAASQSIFGDPNVLREDPDRVARDAWVAWATGIWFWMTEAGAGSFTAHAGITDGHGFGETIRTINGGLECGGKNPTQVNSRIDAYKKFCGMLGVDPGANLGC
ncbi:MAG: glycoside hydrolase family 19 protein [Polyangiales bacterium]